MKNYSENLKDLRNALEISTAKLAKRLDVSQGSIVQYEGNTRKPNYEFIEKLRNILNVNLNWFVSGEGSMFNEPQTEQDKTNRTEIDEEQIKKIFDKLLKERGLI